MKMNHKRFLAILMALMMSLGILPALAEAPAAGTMPNPWALDKTIEVDLSIEVNSMLGSLLTTMTGAQQSEEDQAKLSTVVAAFNKLKASMLIDKNSASGTIGTDKGELFHFQTAFDLNTAQNSFVTSLLPGISLSMDPAMVKEMMPQTNMQQITPEQAQKLMQPYMNALTEQFTKLQQHPNTKVEEGNFVIDQVGTFKTRSDITLTSHMVAGILDKMADIFKEHGELKQMIEKAAKANNMTNTGATAPVDVDESLKNATKELRSKDEEVVMLLKVYDDGANKVYVDAVSPDNAASPAKITLLLDGMNVEEMGKDFSVHMTLLTPGNGNNTAADDTTEPKPVDWATLESEIKSGANYSATMMNMNMTMKNDLPKTQADVAITMVTSGMNFGLTMNVTGDMATMESKNVYALSLMSPEPLLKFTINTKPTDATPAAPALEGTSNIVIKEGDLSDADDQLMEDSLQKALPVLLANLQTALPEEAPAILALMGLGANEMEKVPEPAPANP